MHTIRKTSGILIAVVLLSVHLQLLADESVNTIGYRLQTLEDREAIRNLLIEYGRTLDTRDFKAFSELFARKVGEWDGGMGIAKGPEAIRKLMEETIGKNTGGINTPNFHIFSNETIDVKGDSAKAVSKWAFVVQDKDGKPQWVYLGHYNDTLIREDGRWKFLLRRVTSDIPGEK